MKHKLILYSMVLILAGLVLTQFFLNTAGPNDDASQEREASISAPNDPEMQAAYDKARKSLDYFLGVAESQPPDTAGYALKVGVRDDDLVEFFWVYPFSRQEEGFKGRINEEPELVDNVFKGEVIEFERAQIVDWTFEDKATEIMHGNYTGCVLLEREAPENAAQFQALYGLDCDK